MVKLIELWGKFEEKGIKYLAPISLTEAQELLKQLEKTPTQETQDSEKSSSLAL